MKSSEVTRIIVELCKNKTLSFSDKVRQIEDAVDECTQHEFMEHLECAGLIPEDFGHDSTEEKLCAKYHDALLVRALRTLGLSADVIKERAGAADVTASAGYNLVGDAKAFRLSRTAKNQKDFKVESLDKWRKGADYATLICPLYQYPRKQSQIYAQAIRYGVTMLSYTHLEFLIKKQVRDAGRLKRLWEVARTMKETQGAFPYWHTIDKTMIEIASSSPSEWDAVKLTAKTRLPTQAAAQVEFWQNEKKKIQQLPHELAVKSLIKALKIDAKIKAILNAVGLK